jgi:hypothetical protein
MRNPLPPNIRTVFSRLSLWLLPLLLAAPGFSQQADDLNQIVAVTLQNGKPASVTTQPIPQSAFKDDFVPPQKPPAEPLPPPEKIQPRLKEMLDQRGPLGKERIIINFRDSLEMPRFPDLEPDEPRNSPTNQERLLRSAQLVETLKARRAEEHRRIMADIGPPFRAEFLESFWLINALLVRMPLDAVRGLAHRPDVVYIQLQLGGEEPPIGDGNTSNDVLDGRARISSDAYFNQNLTGGFIGLLDTGVRFTHVQLSNPSHISFRRDCVNGMADYCTTGTNLDPTDTVNHGTSSAAIITANTNQGNDYRGVTAITLDSFKVYYLDAEGKGRLDTAAAVRAFEAATTVGDRVIGAEMQADELGSDYGATSNAANRAFDAGAAVIAANGNYGPNPGSVSAPARARKAIGVGAVDVVTLALYSDQSRGPAADGRTKPDIQAPTNTETASNASDTALKVFGGTSGATPYATGAAALFRAFLVNSGDTAAPGQVYAHMILSGQNPNAENDNDNGAGLIVMPTGGSSLFRGSVSISNGQTINIPLAISGTLSRIDGALWWPDPTLNYTQTHNDIDLYLVSPTGVEYPSVSGPSVFERARATGSVSGTWTLRIHGYQVPAGPQIVYWAAHAR